ncbi:MAG: cell wall metabolism sensor histidine kinase WalK [Planctomycetes bacterium]|nr:cell wall metabolism sensor histidine kinase WalK [Planctomycetota bacterium]
MAISLRRRIFLTLAPLVFLVAVLGVFGLPLLFHTGYRIDEILKENFISVQAMHRLNEALERIDSSLYLDLVNREESNIAAFDLHWQEFEVQFRIEASNITIHPTEDQLFEKLRTLKDAYHQRGKAFLQSSELPEKRKVEFFGETKNPGLRGQYRDLKQSADEILRLNQANMELARDEARASARKTFIGFAAGLGVLCLLIGLLAYQLLLSILTPIREVTAAAQEIGAGRLDHTVPVFRTDELGQLAAAFNTMTQQLRQFRQSNTARLLRAQQTAQASIDSFSDPVLVVDPEGRVELANPAARVVFGVIPSTETTPALAWSPPALLVEPLRIALQQQKPFLAESFDQAVNFQVGGEERAYLPQVRPIRATSGDTLGAAILLNDVTRFRLLDRFKTDLVATVSHELKTPLTGIRLAVHVLLEEKIGPLEPKQLELLLDTRENTERLLRMIEALLAMARLEHGDRLNLQPEAPASLLREAAESIASRAEDKHIQVHVDASDALPAIGIDSVRFRHALGNLLDNALIYTPAGGKITLSSQVQVDGRLRISVADTGIGIAEESLPHVFDKFYRVPGQEHPPGTGLGLAITREIILAHGGTITVESETGHGSTFHISLPLWRGPA